MGVKDFYLIKNVPVAELLLDTVNPRIRKGSDQRDCITRLLRRRKNFMNLLRDIAENGLSIEHIVISRNAEGKWVVRDGNRRVAALKLLNKPDLCPDPVIRQEIQRLAEKYPENVVSHIDCMVSDQEDAILRYIELKHTGANDGVGQENWSALTKAIFNVEHGIPDQNKRAVQLIFWAEEQGIRVEEEFPITNLTRILNQKTLEVIGFRIKNDLLEPIIDIESVRRMVERIINDIANQKIKVEDVFTPDQQFAYVKRVRNEVLPEGPIIEKTDDKHDSNVRSFPVTKDKQKTEPTINTKPNEISLEKSQASVSETKTKRRGSPKKPSWDRTCIFQGKNPGFHIPVEYSKACNVTVELRKLNVKETPIAVAVLLRTLIEISERHYRESNKLKDKEAFHRNIAQAAEHMVQRGYITKDQKEVILRRTREEEGILNVTTLHKYVHSPNFHPSFQIINTLWDEIAFFIAQCWRT